KSCLPRLSGGGEEIQIYTNLDLKDAADVAVQLDKVRIPYSLKDDGRTIAVPKDRADDARLKLAEEGLPRGSGVGFEIFDETKFGTTDFDRRIQFVRAISGELSRTIKNLDAVEDARVQIVMPKQELFTEQKNPVTASVLLRLRGELTQEQVSGIVHLVSSSVEGLEPKNVTIVDTAGRILSSNITDEKVAKKWYQKLLERRQTLENVEPGDKLGIRPATTEAIVKTGETPPKETPKENGSQMSPENQLNLLKKAKEEYEMGLASKAQAMLDEFYPINTAKVAVNVDFGVGKRLKNVSDIYTIPPRRITAVVSVDNRFKLTNKLKKSTYSAVAATIGYNKKRGDVINIISVPFQFARPVKMDIDKKPKSWLSWDNLLLYAATILILALIVYLVLRIRGRVQQQPQAGMQMDEEQVTEMEELRKSAASDPEKVASLLKDWLTEEKGGQP
ncbi:MAG: flagellar basal-body MS-ring/collar protein FliF, partial [bacterium]